MRPKVLIDIKKKGGSFNKLSPQVNLNYTRLIRIPIKLFVSAFLVLFFITSFFFNLVLAPIDTGVQAANTLSSEERKSLEAQLGELEKQIGQYEVKVAEYKKQGKTLQSEINLLNNKVAKLNLQIKAINISLGKVNNDIDTTQSRIVLTGNQINDKKIIISGILRSIYENERKGTLTILLTHYKISDFFSELNNLTNIQDRLRINLEQLQDFQNQLSDQKEILASEKEDIMSLKAYQESQRTAIKKTKEEKNDLLKITKGKESEYQNVLAETKKTAAQIRSRIFELLGGGEIKFEDAYKLAQFASEKTGVNPALILAVLDRESALGKNVGRCVYNKNPYYPDTASNPTTMHPTRDIPIFLQIVQSLNMGPDSVTVSCPIPQDGAYGGGLGPAQFIPSTWVKYQERIAFLTGNNPASPWSNLDAFVATALYLKDAGATNSLGYSAKVAAAKYYAGSRWSRYLSSYGAAVIAKAQDFLDDIATLNA